MKSLITVGDIFYARGQWDRQPLGDLNIPRTVQIAVRQRADRLQQDAKRVLTLAAVVGRRFDFDLLQRAIIRSWANTLSGRWRWRVV